MQLRSVLLLVVALAMAGTTAFLVNGWVSKRQPVAEVRPVVQEPAVPKIEILVAKGELATGTFLKPDQLRWQPWPEDGVNEGYFVKGKVSEKDFDGSVVRARLYAGEPITKERVIHAGEQGFLAAVLEPGKRAISVPVDATRGVAGFVFPGDLVDVLLSLKSSVTSEAEGGGGGAATRFFSQTILSGVRVLGVDQAVDSEGGKPKVAKTATLEVTPKQAERIAVALELGELSLTLHSISKPEADLEGLTRAASKGNGVGPAPAPAKSYTRDMDVLEMIGDPWGLPVPNGLGQKANVVRGSESQVVRF
ncbi:MAG TPA: Flp pilus assembly protein CpaB [Defluviicoccus sp.]|nr:Flp pilus assembly protein CpaB [Defluviicoccus sp.]